MPKKQKKAARKRGKKNVIITSPIAPDVRFVVASELADDRIIEAELVGKVMPFFVYQFCTEGCEEQCKHGGDKIKTGLSVKGTNEVVRLLNRKKDSGYRIRITPEKIIVNRDVTYDGKLGVEVLVYGENLVDGSGGWGVKFESYDKPKADGSGTYKDQFALEKALSKAERNAKRKLIPEQLAIEMMKQIIAHNKGAVAALPPPPSHVEVRAQREAVPTSDEKVFQMTVTAIDTSGSAFTLKKLRKKVERSKRFSPRMKKSIFKKVDSRIDEIETAAEKIMEGEAKPAAA